MMDLHGKTNLTQLLQANNPCGLRCTDDNWQGKEGCSDNDFVIFDSVENGLRAWMINLHTWYQRGLTNIWKLIHKLTPFGDGGNDPALYSKNVSKWTGIPVNKTLVLTKNTYLKLAIACAKMENGSAAAIIPASVYESAVNDVPVDKISKPKSPGFDWTLLFFLYRIFS